MESNSTLMSQNSFRQQERIERELSAGFTQPLAPHREEAGPAGEKDHRRHTERMQMLDEELFSLRTSGDGGGATENALVAGELLGDLDERGVDFTQPRLYILDGAKALSRAVKKHAGKTAPIQRCQIHKRRNVVSHLPEQYRESVDRKMANAYAMASKSGAQGELDKLHRELMELNPSAARSLKEGMEETLTIYELGVSPLLRRTLATTNPIESAFSVVERICSRVKCWRRGDHIERWVGSALWVAEKNFRRVKGYKDLPKLLRALKELRPESAAARSKAA